MPCLYSRSVYIFVYEVIVTAVAASRILPASSGKVEVCNRIWPASVLKWFVTVHWWIIMRNRTNKYIYRYVNLLYYKRLSLLHVSATYCDHLEGSFLLTIYDIECQNNLMYKYKYKSLKFMLKCKIFTKLVLGSHRALWWSLLLAD
jgi:hypothetical protein